MKKVIILSNHHVYTYNFRKEIIERLLDKNYEVYVVLPYGEKVDLLKNMGCRFINVNFDGRSMNPFNDLRLLYSYYKIIRDIRPHVVLSYTIKPNIYGGLVCRALDVPFIPNVTGLGSAVENESLIQKVIISMYKIAFKKASCVFFQNEDNCRFFENKNIKVPKGRIIPGSGVNTSIYSYASYPCSKTTEFIYVSRIMKEKGIDNYLDAAKYIRKKYPYTRFHVVGSCKERNYEDILRKAQDEGIIIYHGFQSDVRKFYKMAHCIIHPTYYPEGMSNVLLESSACGRPVIATNRSGCREIIDNGVNGYLVNQRDSSDLIEKIEKFLALSYEEKEKMGLAGRRKVEKEFDRNFVIDAYLEEIDKL